MDFSWPVTPTRTFEGCSVYGVKPVLLTPGKPYFVRKGFLGIRPRRGEREGGLYLVGVVNAPTPGGFEPGYPSEYFVPYDPPKAEAKPRVAELADAGWAGTDLWQHAFGPSR